MSRVAVIVITLIVLTGLGGIAAAWLFYGQSHSETSSGSIAPTVVVEEPEIEQPIPSLDAMEFLSEVQGWASISLYADSYEIQGWAIDRERDQTIRKVLVYLDGVQIAEVEPRMPRADVLVSTRIDDLESGFELQLEAPQINAAKCVRFVAVLNGSRFGRIGVQVRGSGDEAELCWDPAVNPA